MQVAKECHANTDDKHVQPCRNALISIAYRADVVYNPIAAKHNHPQKNTITRRPTCGSVLPEISILSIEIPSHPLHKSSKLLPKMYVKKHLFLGSKTRAQKSFLKRLQQGVTVSCDAVMESFGCCAMLMQVTSTECALKD